MPADAQIADASSRIRDTRESVTSRGAYTAIDTTCIALVVTGAASTDLAAITTASATTLIRILAITILPPSLSPVGFGLAGERRRQ